MTGFDPVDVVVVGAGPVGLACAIEVGRVGLSARVIEKGAFVNSLTGYPTNMAFFSTPELLEIGDHPFPSRGYKPLREDGIDYYRRVAEAEALDVCLFEEVQEVHGRRGVFTVVTSKGRHPARSVIVATGFFDYPVLLDVPGESLPHVSHYYREPFRFAFRDVVVVGAKNSAAIAALDCLRNGARVTMLVRGDRISDSVKYWIKPDLENRIADGQITAHFNSRVVAIDESFVHAESAGGRISVPADAVLAMTGYLPDFAFLARLGIATGADEAATPVYDPETFETTRPGVYIAGTVCGGRNTSRWFIENGRFHARAIADHLRRAG